MKQINVSVVGMSGTEKERGQIGIGKSCFCNRFVRPLTDDYFIDHISVLSQSDFSGRVVNNDHFLYWGEVRKSSEEGVEYQFNIIEQTEFMDDSTFQPFKVGKMEPYIKRCAATRIVSAEKMMYICKNQLGIEKEYDQKLIPDGRLSIDGFICIFDVSPVPNRTLEKQVEFVSNIITNLQKTKKPIVLVTTKNDDANELYIREAEKICQRKEYKGSISLVETSSHKAINIDLAFILLAQLVEKTKARAKIVTYQEAARLRKDLLEHSSEAVTRLIRTQITDYHTLWSQGSKSLTQHKEWTEFLELFGQEAGQRIFRRHIKKLREENLSKRLTQYMDTFACSLQDLMPDLNTCNMEIDSDWNSVRNYLKNHIDFEQYFFDCGEHSAWTELSDVSDNDDENRIPFDVLDTTEAETVFKNHINALQQEQKRLEWKKQFKKLLEETGYVTPGKQLSEVRVLFMGRECFEALSEHDCQQIYDNHQRELIENAKHNFQELLLEHADLFYHFKSLEPSGTITQDDIKEITDVLQEDMRRYKLLDRLDQDRKLMLFQHLGFVHCPIREHCPAFPNCMDALIERIITAKKSQTLSSQRNHQWKKKTNEFILNLLLLGSDHLASDLINDINLNCGDDGEHIYDGQTYYLNHKIISGDMESFKSIDFQSSGLICIYSNQATFEYIKENLEKSLLCNLELEDKFENLPLVLVYQPDEQNKDENDAELLRTEGQQLADILHCFYVDTSLNFYHHRQSQRQNYIDDIINHLIECIRSDKYGDNYQTDGPDVRIIMCMFCGDPYSVEGILNSLMTEPSCQFSGDRSITLESFIGEHKRKIEIIISSYHGANAFRDELVHGFILLYSAKRKASLATLNAFSMNIPNLPMQIMAITDSSGANAFFNNEICQMLITEGNAIADRLRAYYMTSAIGTQIKLAFYTPFFKEVWEKKPEIEQAFHMEEPVTLDSGEGTLEHSMHHHHEHLPQPPPRHESYLLKNNTNDGSGWLDDALFISRDIDKRDREMGGNKRNVVWNNFSSHHAFTTGRRQNETNSFGNKQPGKLNLKNFAIVNEAIARMNVTGESNNTQENSTKNSLGEKEYSETDSESSSSERQPPRGFDGYYKMNRKAQTHKRMRKKRTGGIPVQPPKIPFGTYVSPPEIPLLYQRMKNEKKVTPEKGKLYGDVHEEESSIDVSSPRDNNSPIFGVVPKVVKENDREKLIDQKRDEKLEKRRTKEESAKLRKMLEKEKELEKKQKRKSKQNSKSGSGNNSNVIEQNVMTLPDFIQSEKNFIPLFMEKCVEFIELEGLDSEGIYRVPGNRAHVDLLYSKFEDESTIDIEQMDIPVNAVATALKDFFSKHLPPIFDKDMMTELEEIAGARGMSVTSTNALNMEVKTDRSCRLLALRTLLNKLPPINFDILKYIFQHFVRVSENAKLNSMDSKNLAICWWPTLLPIEFTDMGHFEQMRPYLEDIVQTMIDQYPFLFCGKEAFVMV